MDDKTVNFTVWGEPCGKARPKFARRGEYVHTYTPEKTVNYETRVKLSYSQEYSGVTFEKDEPLCMTIHAFMTIPQSASKRKVGYMRQGLLRPTKKPDWDNIAKTIGDALNKVAYPDDK